MKIFGDPNPNNEEELLLQRDRRWVQMNFYTSGVFNGKHAGEWTRQNNPSNLLFCTLNLCCLRLQKDMIPGLRLFLLLYSKLINRFSRMHSNAFAFPLLNIFIHFFWGKAKASYLAYKYVVGRMLYLAINIGMIACLLPDPLASASIQL